MDRIIKETIKLITKNTRYLILLLLSFFGCVEEIDLTTETEFENALVIEATITNEFKNQRIKLSRTYPLESDGPAPESNASVRLIGETSDFVFQETEPGIYESVNQFSAQQNVNYQLEIILEDGKTYGSEVEQLTTATVMDELYFEVGLNEDNEEGISILIDAFDPNGNSKFYRYTFEETYKIVAPKWVHQDLIVVEYILPGCPVFGFQLKQEEQQICYNTEFSKTIILENTNVFEEDRIDRFRVRFLNKNNYIISHRYSILVNQYVQSSQAHNYYKVLRDLSASESLLSESQPGFLEGNVFSMSDSNEKVVGFFEVSSVDSKRIYFNYNDVFPGESLPPYVSNCNPFAPDECNEESAANGGSSAIVHAISESQGAKFYDFNDDSVFPQGPYDLVEAPCGNCTVLGNNVPPDFWIE